MEQYPPIALRRHVGGGGFDHDPLEFVAYLKLLLGLEEDDTLWDVGCGYGIVALALEDRGWKGNLVGTDIHGPCVWWAAKNISSRIPSFRFVHADINSQAYWPRGKFSAEQWFTTFAEREFDIVLAKSLFTHMLPAELEIYLRQIFLRLKPGGRACLTFFLLNETQKNLAGQNRNSIDFVWPTTEDTVYAVRNPRIPTATVAYREEYILQKLSELGFAKPRTYYGSWSGVANPLSRQDILVVQKEMT